MIKKKILENKGKLLLGGVLALVLSINDFRIKPGVQRAFADASNSASNAIDEGVALLTDNVRAPVAVTKSICSNGECIGITVHTKGTNKRYLVTIETRDAIIKTQDVTILNNENSIPYEPSTEMDNLTEMDPIDFRVECSVHNKTESDILACIKYMESITPMR